MNRDKESSGSQLIFLISQPRSGSSMLQLMLGSHSRILTFPEPWFMLHLLYAQKLKGISTEYNAKFATLALNEFLKRIPRGQQLYDSCNRDFAFTLYDEALRESSKSIFLDKTPRYYLIADELARLFPAAKMIFLMRNPLAVFASILDYNFQGDWWRMLCQPDRRNDLLLAPKMISDVINSLGDRSITVKYERIVRNPDRELRTLSEKIDVEFEAGMLNYSGVERFAETTFVDTKSVSAHETAVSDYVDSWKKTLDSRMKVALARAYLELLGPEIIQVYGEDNDRLKAELDSLAESLPRQKYTFSSGSLKNLLSGGAENVPKRDRILMQWRYGDKNRSLMTKFGQLLEVTLGKENDERIRS